MSERIAIAATAHGSALLSPSAERAGGAASVTPAGVRTATPQRWQNLAPGVSAALHETQAAPASGDPHSLQNFPLTRAPQEGQGVVTRRNLPPRDGLLAQRDWCPGSEMRSTVSSALRSS